MNSSITFKELRLPEECRRPKKKVFYVIENGRSSVMDNFSRLEKNIQEDIKALIIRMATVEQYKSPKIKYNLKGYHYGEIRPMPHRFFFFQQCGDCLIFFDDVLKKRDSLSDDVYQRINQKKERYEQEFARYIQRH
jgi:hypothetical protein